MSILALTGVEVRHGLLTAVRQLDLELAEGETLALVGANGAGKTSLLRAIAGANPAASGRIFFAGEDVTSRPAYERVRRGIALVPEGRRLFVDLTVRENLRVAQDCGRAGPWDVDAVVAAFPMLGTLLDQRAGNLSGGEQQATAIGRGLVTNPRLLLLDEVSLGLAPVALDDLYASLRRVIKSGTTVVLVEQDLGRAFDVADRIACMLEGRIVLDGAVATVTRERVTDAYFGLAAGGRRGSA
jgi:branched-chain amino acid transport system ATP-binding protein